MSRYYAFALGVFLLSGSVWGQGSPHFKKVVVVVLENTDFDEARDQPFLGSLAKRGALLSQFHALTHPSQPNYIAMISGSTQGVWNDEDVDLDGRHLGDLLEAKSMRWKVYAEQYPGHCFLGATSGNFARKHVPFLSFTNVQNDPQRCARIVEGDQFLRDVKNGDLPEYSLYIPDLDDDGHNTSVKQADAWLSAHLGPVLENPDWTKDLLLVVTFDEGGIFGANHIFTVVYGSGVAPGSVSGTRYDHYSILRTIEDEYGLGTLGLNDAKASVISGIWK